VAETFINLDRMLLHSIPIAEGWNHFVGEIRNNLALDPKLRELAMCGVAVLNGAEYEFFHHAPPFRKAGGTEEQVEALRLLGTPQFPKACFSPSGAGCCRTYAADDPKHSGG
jgi:alkylhydroperoxidase family enzyme